MSHTSVHSEAVTFHNKTLFHMIYSKSTGVFLSAAKTVILTLMSDENMGFMKLTIKGIPQAGKG